MSDMIFKRVRRWEIKRLLVNLTKDRLVGSKENREIRAYYEHVTEIDYVTQSKYTQELINRMILHIHWYMDEKMSGRFVIFRKIQSYTSLQGINLEDISVHKMRTSGGWR
ncbi:hypothetical protein AAHA92_13379 [Salvia divinorum]|uniref:Uncharacterized protein n=1 Tax=Salvia divinorum TaxID=28513 RepID=A0ABD1H8P3_SALDI